MEALRGGPTEPRVKEPIPVSEQQWGSLLRAFIKGNGKFPQAIFSQQILMAPEIVTTMQETGLSYANFFRQEPQHDTVDTFLRAGRAAFHHANKIDTGVSNPTSSSLHKVWGVYHNKAQEFLGNVAWLVHDETIGMETNKLPRVSDERFKKAQASPLFSEFLTSAEQAVETDKIKALQDKYKERITEFMGIYKPGSSKNGIPGKYDWDRHVLMRDLTGLLLTAATITKNDIQEHFAGEYPRFANRIQRSTVDKIFGEVKVLPIDPLKTLGKAA